MVSFACQEVPEIEEGMNVEAKSQKLGQFIADFKRDLQYLQELLNPGTPLEKVIESKGSIEDAAT